jgi:hypothetical protein
MVSNHIGIPSILMWHACQTSLYFGAYDLFFFFPCLFLDLRTKPLKFQSSHSICSYFIFDFFIAIFFLFEMIYEIGFLLFHPLYFFYLSDLILIFLIAIFFVLEDFQSFFCDFILLRFFFYQFDPHSFNCYFFALEFFLN